MRVSLKEFFWAGGEVGDVVSGCEVSEYEVN